MHDERSLRVNPLWTPAARNDRDVAGLPAAPPGRPEYGPTAGASPTAGAVFAGQYDDGPGPQGRAQHDLRWPPPDTRSWWEKGADWVGGGLMKGIFGFIDVIDEVTKPQLPPGDYPPPDPNRRPA